MVEEPEQVQVFAVVEVLLAIVDMAASMVHQLIVMNVSYQLVVPYHLKQNI